MTPETKIDYTAPDKHGVVSVRNCSSQEAFSVANDAVLAHFRDDSDVRRYGLEPIPTSEADGQYDFTFFVYR